MIRFVVVIAILVLGFSKLHWTQRMNNASITTSQACLGLEHEKQTNIGCVYKGVTIDTNFFDSSYVVTDKSKNVINLNPSIVKSFTFEGSALTIKSHLLMLALLATMLIGVYSFNKKNATNLKE